MAIDIRILTPGNAYILDKIGAEVFDHAIDPEQLEAFLADPRHVMVVAVDVDRVVGMASAVEYFHPDKQPQLWINEVGVGSAYRKRGIGRKLVQALIDNGEDRGCTYAWLGTDEDNTRAQACFGSVVGAEQPQPFLLYEWDLEG